MRILVINWQDLANPEAGGAEVHLHEIFGRLAARGHDVTLLASGWAGGAPEAVIDGIRVVRRGTRYTFPLHVRAGFRSLAAIEPAFDVLLEDINKLPLFTPLWSGLPVVGLVPHLFGTTAFRQERFPVAATVWGAERLMPAAYRGRDFIVISDSTARDLEARGFERTRVHVSYPGIDHEFFRPDPDDARFAEPTIAYVGRLRRYKGIDIVLHAVARLRNREVRARFLIVGQGEDRPRLEALSETLGLGERVSFAGYVSEEEKRKILRRAWLNVYPSPKEGWGITNVEAAACGTPSVASDSPGLRESVLHGRTGLLVEHSSVDAWSSALERLLTDEALRADLGNRAVEHAKRFTWDKTANQFEHILRRSASP